MATKHCNGCKRDLGASAFGTCMRRLASGESALRPRGRCRECEASAAAVWRLRNPEKRRVQLERLRTYARQWRGENRERALDGRLRRVYGLTLAERRGMELAQGGRCAICCGARRLVVDHDHATGRVRGLLCDRCNAALGLFRDEPSTMRSAIAYLEQAAMPVKREA